ncbi:hypothetical protein BH20VER1_BH20VER1_00470 [soil metagenome]
MGKTIHYGGVEVPLVPVGRNSTLRVFQIALHNAEQIRDLLGACLVRPKPAVLSPMLQAHARLL